MAGKKILAIDEGGSVWQWDGSAWVLTTVGTGGAGDDDVLVGLSTDTKPTVAIPTGTLFLETDTANMYYWTGSVWTVVVLQTVTGSGLTTFVVTKVGANYIVSGTVGSHSGTNARTEVQWAIDNLPADGGQIILGPNTVFDLGSPAADGLTITQSATKRVNLLGSGHSTKIQYTGTGYAILVNGTSSDSQSFKIGNFIIDGSTKTTGRHGILDQSIGAFGSYHDLHIRNMDEAFRIINSNTRFIERYRVKTCNIGLITAEGSITAANVIHLNDFSISNCATIGLHLGTPWAGPTESDSINNSVKRGNFDACALAIQLSGLLVNSSLEDIYIETGSGTHDIYIKGISNSFPAANIILKNVRGQGNSIRANMIKMDYATKVTLDNVKAVNYTDSMVYLAIDTAYALDIRSPTLEGTPYLINSVAIANNRNLGLVHEKGRVGFIAIMSNAASVEGDVAVLASSNRYIKTTTADDACPVVVMYGNVNTSDRPAVFCASGITPVNIDAAAAVKDTITTSVTSGKAKINNSAIDPKIVIGYVTKTLGATGLTDVRIK